MSKGDLLAIYDRHGKKLLNGNYSPEKGKSVDINLFVGDPPAIVPLIAPVLHEELSMTGILQTEEGLLLLAARPIYTSQLQGPSRGCLLMGRFLSRSLLLSIAQKMSVPFDLLPESDERLTASERELFINMAVASKEFKPQIIESTLYLIITDFVGKPSLLLRIPSRSEITSLGRQTGNILSLALGLISLVLLICLVLYRHRMKTSENQLQALNDELERRVERRTHELQKTQQHYLHAEKLSAIGKLSASIAHEFNNPLQCLMTVLQGFKKWKTLEEDDRVMLDLAISESHRMKNLIRSLQDFNRPSSGKKIFMDVHASIDSLLLLCKSDFKHKKVSTVLHYGERLPQILAIPDQIKQVILNLLKNATDACFEDGGVITISTWREEDKVALAIQDTGIGIQPENIDLIFQPFYTTKPEVKGTGLGLSICHGIVQSHSGEIQVESKPGAGSTFTVLLPI